MLNSIENSYLLFWVLWIKISFTIFDLILFFIVSLNHKLNSIMQMMRTESLSGT